MMKHLAWTVAACLVAGSALADTTVIRREGVDSSTTVVRERAPADVVVKERTETTGTVGCSTKSVTRTDDLGDKTTKTKTDC
jgi:hypothetical protein